MTDPGGQARASIRALRGYEDEAHGGLNLSNNANLFGPNPAIGKAMASLVAEDLWDYPSLTSAGLRERLAEWLKVEPSSVVTGNGSNDLLDVLIRAFVDAGEVLAYHPPTFAMIPIFGRTNAADLRPVPLLPGFALDTERLIATRARITFVVTPNNPTGKAFPREDVLRVVGESRGVVVVDEAYGEYAGASLVPEIARHPNLVVLRTFSKAHGLAGFRVGYAVAHPEVASAAAKVRGPFRLNVVSETVASFALREQAWLDATVAQARSERARLADALAARGFEVAPSDANFLLVKPPVPARRLAEALRARDVHVRDFGGDLADHLRVTVGPGPLVDAFLGHLDATLKEAPA